MAYNNTASLDKPTRMNYKGYGSCQHNLGHFSWFNNDFDYLNVKLSNFERDDNKDFWLVQKFSEREAGIEQFLRQQNLLDVAEEKFSRGRNLISGADSNNIRGLWWTTEAGSQSFLRCGPRKKKALRDSAAVQGGRAREFICSGPIFAKKESGKKRSTECLCEIWTWGTYVYETWNIDLCIW